MVDPFRKRVGEECRLSGRYVMYSLRGAFLTDMTGITALLDRDRCREELTILQVELARLIRWSDKTFKTLQSSIQDWEKKVIEQMKWDEEYKKALDEGDVERRKELDMAEPSMYICRLCHG